MNEVEILIEQLLEEYKLENLGDLAKKLGVAQNTISGWKSRNSVSALKKQMRKNGIMTKKDINISTSGTNADATRGVNEAEKIINDLLDYFGVAKYEELAEKLNTTQAAISQWKKRNSVSAIKRKMRECNIVLLDNYGDGASMLFDPATFELFKSAYSKAVEAQKIKDLQIYLINFEIEDRKDGVE